jgi:hypothetical protein
MKQHNDTSQGKPQLDSHRGNPRRKLHPGEVAEESSMKLINATSQGRQATPVRYS